MNSHYENKTYKTYEAVKPRKIAIVNIPDFLSLSKSRLLLQCRIASVLKASGNAYSKGLKYKLNDPLFSLNVPT
ncbi:hypothetical protein BpHYR1_053546 [Brachionus plicatilis]|uniref:Uncharacterized protein n=1 Tax=Brachionus plicatilis TaxID=10195 RepID=A0A3M7PIV6_BRAPC|nr:hypothetical protein BpHYR1_053546 [Brachionus plicatilis]